MRDGARAHGATRARAAPLAGYARQGGACSAPTGWAVLWAKAPGHEGLTREEVPKVGRVRFAKPDAKGLPKLGHKRGIGARVP